MPLSQIWFPTNRDSDLDNVLLFLNNLPAMLENMFNANNSNFLNVCVAESGFDIDIDLFLASFSESSEEFFISLEEFQGKLGNDENRIFAEQTLKKIGFSGRSLRLKANILNGLWRRVLDSVRRTGRDYIDFTNKIVVRLIIKFLAFLNSILGSLKTLLPGIEIIKESKEIMEGLIGITEK